MSHVADMSARHSVEEIVEQLCASVGGAPPMVKAFGHAYIRRVPGDYLEQASLDDLCGHVRTILEFASNRLGNDVKVRVFNPNLEEHGYVAKGGVVEIVAPDVAFLVDSVTGELTSAGYGVEVVVHPVIGTVRDEDGNLVDVKPARQATTRESVQHYELDRPLSDEECEAVNAGVRTVLDDVRKAVWDFEPMQGAVYKMIKRVRSGGARYSEEEIQEGVAFLEWLLDDNFVFLGYREYAIDDTPEGRAIVAVPHSGLGILSNTQQSKFASPVLLHTLPPAMQRRYEKGFLVVVTKTNNVSRVHRRARMDYIGVRHIDEQGRVSGETRLIGLFTSKAYMQRAESIPVLRRKLGQILDAEDAIAGSHHYKHVVQVFNSVPKEELFATPTDDLRRSIVGLIEAQERERVRLFLRPDLLQRSVAVMVVLPRDRFNADVRRALQDLIKERLGGSSIDYRLSLGEEEIARIHFTVWIDGEVPHVDVEALESEVVGIARTWEEHLGGALVAALGVDRGQHLSDRWSGRFPESYKSATPFEAAVADVVHLDELERGPSPVVALRSAGAEQEQVTHVSVYISSGRLELSEIMPILEHFGLRVIDEVPTRMLDGDTGIHIHDFTVVGAEGAPLHVEECGERVAETITAVLRGEAETDPLARLIISAGLHHREVALLRAYRTYWQRVGSEFTASYMNSAMSAHPRTAARLIRLFSARFDPDNAGITAEVELIEEITSALDRIESLDEDRILRGFLSLILATVRTNAYLPGAQSLAFKFSSADVPGMPAPKPLFEIFVYAPAVEGIHLRGGRVARGGIRWSVRREDYRTEVLGLMKAQMTKNAVIVPTGAKGGFVLRREGQPSFDDVRSAYETFIRGLLDLTDNRIGGTVVHPERLVVHDRYDPYLVVAADKGTATFSDTANELAAEYGFWLGDAFASGGSAGYDHKALGITAKGAWESVRWQLRELGIDPDEDPFTAVGIGDMSGDVFGNGMLLSPHMKLIAAFDHRHVFIDPDPDPVASLAERARLFELPRSSWDDYDRSVISAGGGVWPRAVKRIELSNEAQQALGTATASFTPAELIQAVLRGPVDLLWNGGVGTFVRESDESNADVGDRNNDAIRVTAPELRVKAVGEGGNLGFTQRARIEFATDGGRIFTDFIDNSGGVNCSDREVNLKILLGLAIERGELDLAGRDELVHQVASDVVERILYDNFLQAQILSQEANASAERLETYEQLMVDLEREGSLDRRIERLPDSEELRERVRDGEGLYGPELAVLLTYAKTSLTNQLVASDVPDDPEFGKELLEYFPAAVVERFGYLFDEHPLRRELIATLVANRVINSGGIAFVSRLIAETGATPEDVVRGYQVGRVVSRAEDRWNSIEALVDEIDPVVQRELLAGVDELVEELTRWQLRNDPSRSVTDRIEAYQKGFDELAAGMATVGPAAWKEDRDREVEELIGRGVPKEIALSHVHQPDLANGLSIVDVATSTGRQVLDVGKVFLSVGASLHLDWLEDQADEMATITPWQRQAMRVVRDDMGSLRRRFAEHILAEGGPERSAQEAMDHFLADRTQALGQLARFFRTLSADGASDIATLVVALRRISRLIPMS